MPVEDLQSPPYPNEGVTADGLLAHLRALRKWVLLYRVEHNKVAGQDLIPTVKALPDKTAYISQPVLTQMGHLLFLQKVRERWDHLVRIYEHDWDDAICVRQRIMLLASAAVLINSAFAPFEHKEARRRTELEDCQRTIDSVANTLQKLMEPRTYEPTLEEGPD